MSEQRPDEVVFTEDGREIRIYYTLDAFMTGLEELDQEEDDDNDGL